MEYAVPCSSLWTIHASKKNRRIDTGFKYNVLTRVQLGDGWLDGRKLEHASHMGSIRRPLSA